MTNKTRLGHYRRSHPVYNYHLFKLFIHYFTLNKRNMYVILIFMNIYEADMWKVNYN